MNPHEQKFTGPRVVRRASGSEGRILIHIRADENHPLGRQLEDWEVEDMERMIRVGTLSINEIAWRIGCSSRTVQRNRARVKAGRERWAPLSTST